VEALAAEASCLRDLRHAFGPSDIAERRRHQARIAFLERRLQIVRDIFFAFQMLGHIPRNRFDLCLPSLSSALALRFHVGFSHELFSLQRPRKRKRQRDISILRALVTTGEQYDQVRTTLHEIDSVSWAVVDAQLRNASPTGFTSPGLPRDRRRIRALMRATA